jgi:L-ascorbate metabolism protein UlaG (beta-lactamase superfamily)
MTYIGGPTLLIEHGGLTVSTDPTSIQPGTDYTIGPVTLLKTTTPAVAAVSLGNINIVLLSREEDTALAFLAR